MVHPLAFCKSVSTCLFLSTVLLGSSLVTILNCYVLLMLFFIALMYCWLPFTSSNLQDWWPIKVAQTVTISTLLEDLKKTGWGNKSALLVPIEKNMCSLRFSCEVLGALRA